ncbi:hypothetical protein VPH35_005271 [Triticum aestivum]
MMQVTLLTILKTIATHLLFRISPTKAQPGSCIFLVMVTQSKHGDNLHVPQPSGGSSGPRLIRLIHFRTYILLFGVHICCPEMGASVRSYTCTVLQMISLILEEDSGSMNMVCNFAYSGTMK